MVLQTQHSVTCSRTRFAYEEDIYISLMRSALVGWNSLAKENEEDIFARTGGLDIGTFYPCLAGGASECST
jgi:hypothetical protein